MKAIEGEALRNAYLKVTVNAAHRRLYFRDVRMYTKVPRRTLPPLPPYPHSHKPPPHAHLTETEDCSEELREQEEGCEGGRASE